LKKGVKMKEQLFKETLQNLFVGPTIEGKGGFVNLAKIRTKYYQKIEKVLKEAN
jgi:hypothetical protein